MLESPEACHTPHSAIQRPLIPQLNFGPAVNISIAQYVPEDPFQILPPAPVPPQYQHLPPALAQQLAALPPMPPPVHRGRHQQHQPPPPPLPINQIPPLPQQLAALPPMPSPVHRGRPQQHPFGN